MIAKDGWWHRRRTGLLYVWALCALLCGPAHLGHVGGSDIRAQESRPSPPDTAELTVAIVESRRTRVEADPELDEATKSVARDAYREAREALDAATKAEAQADTYDRLRLDAPRLLEETRAALAALPQQAAIEVPPQASLEHSKGALLSAEARVVDLQRAVSRLDEQVKTRADRRTQIQKDAAAGKVKLGALAKDLDALATTTERTEVVLAKRTKLLAAKRAIEAGLDGDRREVLSYDARVDLLAARRDLAARDLALAEKRAQLWRERVNEEQRRAAERDAREAREAVRAAAEEHPSLLDLAQENARLTEVRTNLTGPIERVTRDLEGAEKALASLTGQSEATRKKVEKVGVTKAISLLLRRLRAELPNVAQHRRNIRARQSVLSDVQFQLLETEDTLRALTEQQIQAQVEAIGGGLKSEIGETERKRIETAALDLLQSRRGLLDSLVKDYERYFGVLVDLDGRERALVTGAEEFAAYVDQQVLWFPSASPLRPADASRAWEAIGWLGAPANWVGVAHALWADVRANPLPSAVGVLIVGVLILWQWRLRARLRALADLLPRAQTDAFRHTIAALLITVLMAAALPAVLWLVGWRLRAALSVTVFPKALGEGLLAAGLVAVTLNFVRALCVDNGLAHVHYRWPRAAGRTVRIHLKWLIPITTISAFTVFSLEAQSNVAYRDSLGRAALIVALLALGVFLWRVCRPSGPALKTVVGPGKSTWLSRLRYVWYPLGIALPVGLAGIAAWGYTYTALELSRRMLTTTWLILGLIVGYGLLTRWLFVVRRRLSLREAQERRESAEAGAPMPGVAEAPAVVEEPEASLFVLGLQTREFLRSLVAVVLLVGLGLIWLDILRAPGGLTRIMVWGGVSVAHLIGAVVTVFLTIFLAKNIPGVLEIGILRRLSLEAGVRFAITTIARYTITVVGIVMAFGAIGISWSKIQWLVAAMTVGLGFGLQEIFANFVSGLIILFERPIRVGDTVTVGETTGTVSRIRIRATTITDWDRKELVVPNKEFITGRLVNWSLSDTILRVRIPVGVAYGSDTELAERILLRLGREHPDVLETPRPQALFLEFGDNSLNFELRVFIPNISVYLKVVNELHLNIDWAFRQGGITIAFPQQDVHLDAPGPIDVRVLAPDRIGSAPASSPPAPDASDQSDQP